MKSIWCTSAPVLSSVTFTFPPWMLGGASKEKSLAPMVIDRGLGSAEAPDAVTATTPSAVGTIASSSARRRNMGRECSFTR